MTKQKAILSQMILAKEAVAENKTTLEIMDYYTKVSQIIERTHIAMGKKKIFKTSIASTSNEPLNTDAYTSTLKSLSRLR
jgi:hypothetical protein